MKTAGKTVCLLTLSVVLLFCSLGTGRGVSSAPGQDILVKARQNTKLEPVPFSHKTHVDKHKVDCGTCHHTDAAEPASCTTCHMAEAKDKTSTAKEAFHEKCRSCHKEQVAIKCYFCHHKPESGK
jgi:hypothetical protein